MLDGLLDWAAVLLPTLLSVAGVFVSIKAPHSKHHKALRFGLIAIGVLVSIVTLWQQSRSRSTHAAEVVSLNGTLDAVRGDLKSVQSHTASLESEIASLKSAEQSEVARRQQAEKDLTLIVTGSGKATRQGVAEDIKKNPFKVEVSGQGVRDPEEIKRRLNARTNLGSMLQLAQTIKNICLTDPPPEGFKCVDQADAWARGVLTYTRKSTEINNVVNYLTFKSVILEAFIRELQ